MKAPHFAPARLQLDRGMALGMALRRQGPSSAPVLLYVHGLGESGLCFEDVLADRRLDHYHQIAPDLLGYGKSAWAPEPLDLEGHARQLAALLDALSIQRKVVLVGHSMGGVIGWHFARLFPHRVLGLLNVEGNISSADCRQSSQIAGQPLADFLDHGWGRFLMGLYEAAETGGENASEERDAPEVLRAYAASVQICDPRALHRNSEDLVRESAHEQLASYLAATQVPHLYLYGSPRGTGHHSRALLRQAGLELRKISPAGHWAFLDQRAAFLEALLAFCGRLGH